MSVLLTRKEAAVYLGISLVTLDAARNEGRLAYIQHKPNGKVWISEDAIQEFLAQSTHPAKPIPSKVGWTYRKRRK